MYLVACVALHGWKLRLLPTAHTTRLWAREKMMPNTNLTCIPLRLCCNAAVSFHPYAQISLKKQITCTLYLISSWRFGSVGNVVGRINEVNRHRARLVLGWVTVRLQAGKPSRYVTSRPGQLSLAIPPWVGAVPAKGGL